MIIDRKGMQKIESLSGFSSLEIMETVSRLIADKIMHAFSRQDSIVVLAGNGNNGGDGYTICKYLKNYTFKILPIDGEPVSNEAIYASKQIDSKYIYSYKQEYIDQADLIIDAVYGFSYHGELKKNIRDIFRYINQSNKTVYSIDINSGAEADSDYHDLDAIHSTITFALDCYKPFHMLQKEHQLFDTCELIDLHLPHTIPTKYYEMNEERFFSLFPKKPVNAYKGTYGKTYLVGGSYGCAGALSLNIIGAKTVGTPYINVSCPDEIYPIVAAHHITPVFHPFNYNNYEEKLYPRIKEAKAIAFGSGAVCMPRKVECMDMILQESTQPVILDAEALRLLVKNTWILRFVNCPVIITPHLGEFASICNQPIEVIKDHKLEYAKQFARKNKVYVVLKGPNTIVVSPNEDVYINQSGNQSLAQAGSGDLLVGILAGILTMTTDIFHALCMGVWLHGYLADYGNKIYSRQSFPIEKYPEIMNEVFKNHGF